MDDLISRQAAIDVLEEQIAYCDKALKTFGISMKDEYAVKVEKASLVAYKEQLEAIPAVQPEPLTDKEQRIFLAAMERERKVCKEVDDRYVHEPYKVLLTKVCNEIERKVKKVLWT